jgi:CubicO group peptidase (beta-lactamase class C family)
MKFNLKKVLLLLIGLCLYQNSFSQKVTFFERKIDSLFATYNSETPGVAVAVMQNGKIVFEKGYGMANLEYNIPITPNTVFHVASVSKQFTAFAIYLLEKEDKISFDDDIRKYLPEIPSFGSTITIQHLLSHTSGLKDQWALLTLAGWRMDDVITTEQILKLIRKQEKLNFPPGTQFQYSNTGYTLLAEIIEKVTGMSFSDYTTKSIFEPLGMVNSQFYDDHEKIVKNRAYSYAGENEKYKKRKLNYSNVGPTSLFTTVEDMAKWARNFEKPIIGDQELINRYNEISTLHNGDPAILGVIDGETIYHSKGQFKRNYKGLTLYNHTGGDAGFRTYLARFPEKEFSVILFSNDADFDRLGKGLKIAELFLKESLTPRAEAEPLKKTAETNIHKDFNTKLLDLQGSYYSSELTTTYHLTLEDDTLKMSHRRLDDITLTRVDDTEFMGTIWFNVQLEFLLNKNDRVLGFNISNFGAKNVRFNKLPEKAYVRSDNNNSPTTLVENQLIAYNTKNLEEFLQPYSQNVEVFDFPSNKSGSGIEFLKENYLEIFNASPNLHCEILNRMVLGNIIIDHERVSGLKNLEPFEAVAIYKIENNKISKIYFIKNND